MTLFYISSKASGRHIKIVKSEDNTHEGIKATRKMLMGSFPTCNVEVAWDKVAWDKRKPTR